MGRAARARPKHLAQKLLKLRKRLGLSQNELISQIKMEGELTQRQISAFERGKNEPNLIVLLRISRLVGGRMNTGKYLEMLLDDALKLRLPKQVRSKIRSQRD